MTKDNYTPGEIRKMLGISRSALRYYIRKDLLEVDKSDENGYHTFSKNNLSDLRDISYLRQVLDFSINDIQDCFNAATPDDYESIFTQKRQELEAEIARKKVQHDRLAEWESYLKHLKNTPDSIGIVEFDKPFVFSTTFSPDDETFSLLCSSFELNDGIAEFVGHGYCLDEPEDTSNLDIKCRFPAGKYIYAMCSSEYEMDNPKLLEDTLSWAKQNKYKVKGPIQVDYFYRLKSEEGTRYYYAITVPFEA